MIRTEDIQELVETVWATMLDVQLEPVDVVSLDVPDPVVTACVHITGDWEGSVLIQCSEGCANQLTGKMFAMETDEVSDGDMRDAMGELSNMVGGNFKGLLSGECHLSLPTVVSGSEYTVSVKGARMMHAIGFDGEGSPLRVEVYQRGT